MEIGNLIFMLALVLLLGVGFGKLAKAARLPAVSGYLLAGILFGPYLLGAVHIGAFYLGFTQEFIDAARIIGTVAFSFICFSLGEEVNFKQLKKDGSKAALIALIQSVSSVILVGGVFVILAFFTDGKLISMQTALVLAALAAVSAPAAKFMITRQYKTHGELTEMMVPIVALDDLFGIIIFSVIIAIVPSLDGGHVSVYSLLLSPLIEVIMSAAIGLTLGIILGFLTKIYKVEGARLALCIGFILLSVAVSELFKGANNGVGLFIKPAAEGHGEGHIRVSPLLISIVMGGVFSYINHEHGLRKKLDGWIYPMLVAFFVLAGAGFDIKSFWSISIIAVALIYILFRSVGKYFGTRLAARAAGESKTMQKYLGITLLPQADVAIELAVFAVGAGVLSITDGDKLMSIVFLAAIIFEIVGHILIRAALKRAGETHGDLEVRLRRLKLSKFVVRHDKRKK